MVGNCGTTKLRASSAAWYWAKRCSVWLRASMSASDSSAGPALRSCGESGLPGPAAPPGECGWADDESDAESEAKRRSWWVGRTGSSKKSAHRAEPCVTSVAVFLPRWPTGWSDRVIVTVCRSVGEHQADTCTCFKGPAQPVDDRRQEPHAGRSAGTVMRSRACAVVAALTGLLLAKPVHPEPVRAVQAGR